MVCHLYLRFVTGHTSRSTMKLIVIYISTAPIHKSEVAGTSLANQLIN